MSQTPDNHPADNKLQFYPPRDSHSESAPVSAATPQSAPGSGPAQSETRKTSVSLEQICLEIHNQSRALARKKFPGESEDIIQDTASGAVAALWKDMKNPATKISKCAELGLEGAMNYVVAALKNNLMSQKEKLWRHKARGEVLSSMDEIERLADGLSEGTSGPGCKEFLNHDDWQRVLAEAEAEGVVFGPAILEPLSDLCAEKGIAMPESLAAREEMSKRTRQRREAEGKEWLRKKIKNLENDPGRAAVPRAAGCPAPEQPLKSQVSLASRKNCGKQKNHGMPQNAKET